MLNDRIERIDGLILFRLYPQLELLSTAPASLFVTHGTHRYVRVDRLRDD